MRPHYLSTKSFWLGLQPNHVKEKNPKEEEKKRDHNIQSSLNFLRLGEKNSGKEKWPSTSNKDTSSLKEEITRDFTTSLRILIDKEIPLGVCD